jgi:hypothetical protein
VYIEIKPPAYAGGTDPLLRFEFNKMPQLKWNEYDFVECLGVLPKTEEYETDHFFRLKQDGLIVEMTIWQYESLIAISITQDKTEKPFLTFFFVVRDEVKFRNDKEGSRLEFIDSVIVPLRFYHLSEGNVFEKANYPTDISIELWIYPKLEIKIT